MHKILLALSVGLICFISAGAQENGTLQPDRPVVNNPGGYWIQVTTDKDDQKYFPKLYSIGYIVREKDESKQVTKYFLADFGTRREADIALVEVKASGYTAARIVQARNPHKKKKAGHF